MHAYGLRRLSDERLGGRLAAGEAAAFDELYRRYVHRLAAYGAHLLGDAAAGEDVAQSALLKAYGALRSGSGPELVRPWLFRIAHNAALDLVARRREVLSPSAIDDQAAPESEPFAGALVEALAALPDRQRRVYALREVHGLRIDETAAELGLSSAQVEQALFAARNRLAELLTFGERLSCVAVRRLATGPLEPQERRSLKTHLRSCPGCRTAVGARGAALSLPFLDWLRALPGLLVGGGAPVVAKVGLVAATATLAAVPVTLRDLRQPKPSPGLRVVTSADAVRPARTPAPRLPVVAPASPQLSQTNAAVSVAGVRHMIARTASPVVARGHRREDRRSVGGKDSTGVLLLGAPTASDGGDGGGRGEGDGGRAARPVAVAVAVSADNGGGGDGSGDGGQARSGTTTTTTAVAPIATDSGSPSGSDGSDDATAFDGTVTTAGDDGSDGHASDDQTSGDVSPARDSSGDGSGSGSDGGGSDGGGSSGGGSNGDSSDG